MRCKLAVNSEWLLTGSGDPSKATDPETLAVMAGFLPRRTSARKTPPPGAALKENDPMSDPLAEIHALAAIVREVSARLERLERQLNRSLASRTITLLVALLAVSAGVIRAEEGESQTNHASTVVRSFYDLPSTVTVMKAFPSDTDAIVKQFKGRGVVVKPLPGKTKEHGYGFVSQSTVVARGLHGTIDAPFSLTMFTVQHPAGISMDFEKPQAVVAMTITGPTTQMDVGIDLLFFDEKGRLIRKVKADTQHQKELDFDSRGAVFRGLSTPMAIISSVHVVPTHVPAEARIVLAGIDYVCFSAAVEDESSTGNVMELVAKLGHKEYQVREDATKKLESLGPDRLAVLRRIDAKDDPEARWRLLRIIHALEAKRSNLTVDGNEE